MRLPLNSISLRTESVALSLRVSLCIFHEAPRDYKGVSTLENSSFNRAYFVHYPTPASAAETIYFRLSQRSPFTRNYECCVNISSPFCGTWVLGRVRERYTDRELRQVSNSWSTGAFGKIRLFVSLKQRIKKKMILKYRITSIDYIWY